MKRPDPSPVAPNQLITRAKKAMVVKAGDIVFFDPDTQDFVINKLTPHPAGIGNWVFNLAGLDPKIREDQSTYFGWTLEELVEIKARPEEFLP